MKTSLILFLIVFSVVVQGQSNENFKEYFKSGKLKSEVEYDSKSDSHKIKEYFESGIIRRIATTPTGENTHYYENGVIQLYENTINSVPTGRTYFNYENGKLGYENYYSKGYKTGTWKYYNEDGSLREQRIYLENKTKCFSDIDYSTISYYLNDTLAYTLDIVAGRETNLKIINQSCYDKLIAMQPPLGEKLFKENCTMCHAVKNDIIGPKMKSVTKKREEEWLVKMITNGEALIKSGDPIAVKLFHKYKNFMHPNFERFSREEVMAIIDYLKKLK